MQESIHTHSQGQSSCIVLSRSLRCPRLLLEMLERNLHGVECCSVSLLLISVDVCDMCWSWNELLLRDGCIGVLLVQLEHARLLHENQCMSAMETEQNKLLVDVNGCSILVSKVTFEKKDLEGDGYQLGSTTDGDFLQRGDEEAQWVSDIFEYVLETLDGQWHVTDREGVSVSLSAFMSDRRTWIVPVQLLASTTIVEATIHSMCHSFRASELLWEATQLRSNLLTDGLSSAEWYQSWYPHWAKRLERLQIPVDFHMRRGAVSKGTQKAPRTLHFGVDLRFFDKPVFTTHAFLLFLLQWSAGSARQNQDTAARWRDYYQSLCRRVFGQDLDSTWIVSDSTSASIDMGEITGADRAELKVQGGMVNIGELAGRSRRWQKLFHNKPWPELIEVHGFLSYVHNMGARAEWLLVQLCHCAACDIEAHIIRGQTPEASVGRDITMSRRRKHVTLRARLSRLALSVRPKSATEIVPCLLRYWLKARGDICKNAEHVHLAMDASRTGGRQRMYSFVTVGEFGFWSAPLVRKGK
eukprot:1562765-Amphidinium_carterae.2